MIIKKTIAPFKNNKTIEFAYVNEEHRKHDTGVFIYDTYKITIYLSDNLASITNNKVLNTSAGDIIFYRPDEINFGRFMCDGKFEYLEFLIPLGFFEDFYFEEQIIHFFEDTSKDRVNIICPDSGSRREIIDNCRKIIELIKTDCPAKTPEMFSYFYNVVMLCNKLYPEQKQKEFNPLPIFVSKALSFISDHFAEKITLSQIAEYCGCSVTYISKVFKSYTGMSIYKYITRTRISMSQNMLKSGMTVTESCFACGFSDCSNFIKTFKDLVGKTPIKYRNDFNR